MSFTPRFLKHRGITVIQKLDPSMPRVPRGKVGLVLAGLTAVALTSTTGRFPALMLVAVLAYRVLPPYWQVRKDPQPAVIRRAVKAGVLSLVLLDSSIGAAYAGPVYAAIILATGLVAGSLARLFSVT